ncbi:MAG: DUF4174 domain-containing protein [Pseudomonadota bacterium]
MMAPTGKSDESQLDAYLWEARPVIIFADSDRDPRFIRQVAALEAAADEMAERDVVILTDTDPAAAGPLRQEFRPRDFQIILIGKDGQTKMRRPHPISAEDLNRQIDRMPMRRREMIGGQS